MSREQAIEAGLRAWHAAECCPDWPSAYCEGPSSRDREHMAAVIDAAAPHLVGEPVGYVVVNRALEGFVWIAAEGYVYDTLKAAKRRAGLDRQGVAALMLVPAEDQP